MWYTETELTEPVSDEHVNIEGVFLFRGESGKKMRGLGGKFVYV